MLILTVAGTDATTQVLKVELTQRLVSTLDAEHVLLDRAADPSVASVVVLAGDLDLDPQMVERWHSAFERLGATRKVVVVLGGQTNTDVLAMVAPASRIVAPATALIAPGLIGRHVLRNAPAATARAGEPRYLFSSGVNMAPDAARNGSQDGARNGVASASPTMVAELVKAWTPEASEVDANETVREIWRVAVYYDWLRGALNTRAAAATEGLAAIEGVTMIDIARAMKIGLVDAVGDSEAAVEWAKSMITNSQGAIAVISFTPDK